MLLEYKVDKSQIAGYSEEEAEEEEEASVLEKDASLGSSFFYMEEKEMYPRLAGVGIRGEKFTTFLPRPFVSFPYESEIPDEIGILEDLGVLGSLDYNHESIGITLLYKSVEGVDYVEFKTSTP